MQRFVDCIVRNRLYLWPGAAAIAWTFPPWYGSTPSWTAAPSITLAGLGLYQLNRVYDVVEDEVNDPSAYARISASRTSTRNLAVAAVLASVVTSSLLGSGLATALLSVTLLLGIAYSVPLITRDGAKPRRLKEVMGLKNAVPAVVWAVTTVLYPATSHAGVQVPQLLLAVTGLACLVFTVEVAWDVRDMPGDRVAGIETLASAFGAGRALLIPIGTAALLAFAVGLLVHAGSLPPRWLVPASLLVLLPPVAYVWKSSLALDRDRSHLLVALNVLALVPMYVFGHWSE